SFLALFSPRAATSLTYTLSLHDALPISVPAPDGRLHRRAGGCKPAVRGGRRAPVPAGSAGRRVPVRAGPVRGGGAGAMRRLAAAIVWLTAVWVALWEDVTWANVLDRKSTRLNSSHVKSSYAVFCLMK